MAIDYDKHNWAYGEEITPDKLNNVENGIKANADAINEVNNNLAEQKQLITSANKYINGYNLQPIIECFKEHYDELPLNTSISGLIHIGKILHYTGYKINNGDYASFFCYDYSGEIYHVIKNNDEWECIER